MLVLRLRNELFVFKKTHFTAFGRTRAQLFGRWHSSERRREKGTSCATCAMFSRAAFFPGEQGESELCAPLKADKAGANKPAHSRVRAKPDADIIEIQHARNGFCLAA